MAKTGSKVSWGLVLFGLVFFSVGAGMGVWSLHTLLSARAMQSWDEIPAQIQECRLERSQGRKGSVSYKATATYSYTVNGKEYTSRRVALDSGSDNIGSFQRQTHETLKAAKNSGAILMGRVNPANPEDAILFWKPRPEMVLMKQGFAIVFGGVGLLILCGALFGGCSRHQDDRRIRMEGANTHLGVAVAAAVFSAYVLGVFWLQVQTLGFDGCPWWVYGPLILRGGLILKAAYHWIRFKKFGISTLEISPHPAKLRQPLRVAVHIPNRLDSAEVHATLRCVHQYTTGSGKSRSTHKQDIWKETKQASLYTAGENESQARVDFEIGNYNATTAGHGKDGYWWELTLKSEVPGVNYKATFAVPVEGFAMEEGTIDEARGGQGRRLREP